MGFINHIKMQNNIDINTHSGSYELVEQGVACLTNVEPEKIDVPDLEMLFHFGNLRHGKEVRNKNIAASNLSNEDKKYMIELNEQISAGSYSNSGLDNSHQSNGNCGLFAKGRQTLIGVSDKETAQTFIQMLIAISKLDNGKIEDIFRVAEIALSKKLKGLGAGIASQILHLLKPNIFPILNSVGRNGYVTKLGLPLVNETDISHYIHNVKIITDFRNKELPSLNFRTIDVAMWNETQINDYQKYQRLLAWFVNQLDINNGVIEGEKVTGYGYKGNSSLRQYYTDYRNYEGFDLDCTIAHKYGNYATSSNYINLADTDLNTIPEFDGESKAVISLYIGNHPPEKSVERKSESVAVANLGLSDTEPNQALMDFFDLFKQLILEFQSNSAHTQKASLEEEFRSWFQTQKNKGLPFSATAQYNYSRALKEFCKDLTDIDLAETDLFYQTNLSEFVKIEESIRKSEYFAEANKYGNQVFSAALKKYKLFLAERENIDSDSTLNENDTFHTVISLKEFAINVLEETQEPMTDIEIWAYGADKGWDEQLNSVGKTPWQSIYAILSNYKDGTPNPDKRIKIIDSEQRRKFAINSIDSEDELPQESSTDFNYNIGISKEQWIEMLDNSVIAENDIELLRKWLYLKGQATCTEVGKTYNAHPSSYIAPVFSMSRRIHKYMNCKTRLDESGNIAWWNIPFVGKYINGGEHFEWTIRPEFYEALLSKGITPLEPPILVKYDKEDFLTEVYFESEDYDDIAGIIERKMNIILQGAPGVGKSYMAKRLAYSIIGVKDESKIEMVQFHQNYSYEDFIEGFRPNEDGKFIIRKGIFYNFCEKAKYDKENKYFFIIDEINRGNLSKVMGELMLLLENDKRGVEFEMSLTYSGEKFYVPENVYVIGMMNTADRSLAMIDYALRRRFSFIPVEPVFDDLQFISDFKNNYPDAEVIAEKIKRLNKFITENLDSGHQVGHSYFCSKSPFTSKDIEGIIKYEILELLNEYFYDDTDNLEKAKDLLK